MFVFVIYILCIVFKTYFSHGHFKPFGVQRYEEFTYLQPQSSNKMLLKAFFLQNLSLFNYCQQKLRHKSGQNFKRQPERVFSEYENRPSRSPKTTPYYIYRSETARVPKITWGREMKTHVSRLQKLHFAFNTATRRI